MNAFDFEGLIENALITALTGTLTDNNSKPLPVVPWKTSDTATYPCCVVHCSPVGDEIPNVPLLAATVEIGVKTAVSVDAAGVDARAFLGQVRAQVYGPGFLTTVNSGDNETLNFLSKHLVPGTNEPDADKVNQASITVQFKIQR